MPINERDLFNLIPNEPWTRLHKRVWETPGAIVDIGAAGWDWCGPFLKQKLHKGPMLVVDPFLGPVPTAYAKDSRLLTDTRLVSSVRGQLKISSDGIASSMKATSQLVPVEAITLTDLLSIYKIDRIAALKMNVEGAEYEILITQPESLFANIDQIAVSFHDFVGHGSYKATQAMVDYLGNWYDVAKIDDRWSWYLCVKK